MLKVYTSSKVYTSEYILHEIHPEYIITSIYSYKYILGVFRTLWIANQVYTSNLKYILEVYAWSTLLWMTPNVTGQSQQSEGSDKSARIKEVHPNYIRSRLRCVHSQLLIQPWYTFAHIFGWVFPLGCLIKQAGIIIHTILNMWGTPGIEPVTTGLTSVYQISRSTTWAIPPHCQVNLVPTTNHS